MAFSLEDVTALTDEQITPEIEAVLLPKLAARATSYLTNNGHVVKPKTEYDTEFNAALTTKQKEFADSEAPKFYGSMERMLAAAGLPKPPEMKTRVWVEKLSAEGKLPFTPEQWTKIDKAIKGEPLNPTEQGLANQYLKELNDYKTSQETKDKTKFSNTVAQIVSAAFRTAPVPVDPTLKDDAAKENAKKSGIATVKAVFDSVYEAAEDDKGVMYFRKKGTTDAIMDTSTGEPMSPLDIMKKEYPTLFAAKGHQQNGGGTGGGAAGGSVSTKADIYRAASDKGLRMHSKDWKEFVKGEEEKLK
ncbi:hypothetical protein [Spirosoma flavum]|uniref:Phage protein n=1 Tax=Spirosoma flavum TaxID=2048557 RepID=A0ABW6AQB1_9BACT